MTTAMVLGFTLIPLALLLAAVAINRFQLWSIVGNLTFPWLCGAVAVSLLFLGAICLIMQVSPRSLPPRISALTVIALLVVYGVGLVVDGLAYHPRPHDWKATIAGWVGFAVILAGVFSVAHL